MTSAWQQYKKNLGESRPWHMLDPTTEMADKEVAESRIEICKLCPELIKMTHQCKKCGCFMNIKTKLKAAKCPIEKW